MSKTVLSVSKAHLSYNHWKSFVLRDISFSLHEGEILSIIGKNGSGKSSLLKAIAGIQKLHSGKITRHSKRISYVPQKLSLEESFPLRSSEFVRIFNDRANTEETNKLFREFHSEQLQKKNLSSLSGGEFQKVLIINALLLKPDILLLDEPTSGIDALWEEQFYENIAKVQESYPKIAIVLVSHNLHLVYKNSTRVICLHEHNLCCHGTPSEVLQNENVSEIFGKYLRPYEHSPHADHHHTH